LNGRRPDHTEQWQPVLPTSAAVAMAIIDGVVADQDVRGLMAVEDRRRAALAR
jgi:hypothetical protein